MERTGVLAARHLLCQTSQCLGQCVSHHFMLNQCTCTLWYAENKLYTFRLRRPGPLFCVYACLDARLRPGRPDRRFTSVFALEISRYLKRPRVLASERSVCANTFPRKPVAPPHGQPPRSTVYPATAVACTRLISGPTRQNRRETHHSERLGSHQSALGAHSFAIYEKST